jgi:hypothetical protein
VGTGLRFDKEKASNLETSNEIEFSKPLEEAVLLEGTSLLLGVVLEPMSVAA